ncbi:MAG: hypothetical protein QG616_654, partial [Pseudomonadota bacterium]|nr:hypothetical protein [Pseudomonadota bacterium]
MKDVLYICVKNPFCQRDVERMGIESLERIFDVRILDCTEWLMPMAFETRGRASVERANLHRVRSLNDFRQLIDKRRGGFAVDYVGQFSVAAVLLFHALKRNGTRIIIVDSGSYPSPDLALGRRSKIRKLIDSFRHGILLQMFKEKCVRWLLKVLPDQSPDYAFVAGKAWQGDPRFRSAANHIPAHSFDYEIYRACRSSTDVSVEPYAVYLDETIAGHEDNAELGLPEPASAERFYPALRQFFDRFEATTGLPVVIAAYPSANLEACNANFGGRKVLIGRTAELVRDSRFVFAHASTAISYAVLWRKPIGFLTSSEIRNGWYQPWIDAPRILLNAPLFDIDERFPEIPSDDWFRLEHDAY